MAKTSNEELGHVTYSDLAIAQIAANAAMECIGVVGMSYRSAKSNFARILKGEHSAKGIEVKQDGDRVSLNVYVIIKFETKISVVAENIIENVKYAVEKHTGLIVDNVNLNIEGVKVTD